MVCRLPLRAWRPRLLAGFDDSYVVCVVYRSRRTKLNYHSLTACCRTCIKDTTDGSSSRKDSLPASVASPVFQVPSTAPPPSTTRRCTLACLLAKPRQTCEVPGVARYFFHTSNSSRTVRQDIIGYDSIDTSHRWRRCPLVGSHATSACRARSASHAHARPRQRIGDCRCQPVKPES